MTIWRSPIRLAFCGTLAAAMFWLLIPFAATAEVSVAHKVTAVEARLISAEDAVSAEAQTLSAGLDLNLADGWKTYWRSPGEVGIPPQIDWSGSTNVAGVDFLWPAPERFTAFGIENFGYHDEVVFPLQITLKDPGEPVELRANVKLLTCSAVCVPQDFDLALSLPQGNSIDQVSANRIGAFLARVPAEGGAAGVTAATSHINDDFTRLTIEIAATTAFKTPDVFPEIGDGNTLGKPDIRLGASGRTLWAEFPILAYMADTDAPPRVTVTDGPDHALTVTPDRATTAPTPPFSIDRVVPGIDQVIWIAIIAFLGGLILNAMPCVLPVLSIKLSSALKSEGRGNAQVRAGFLAAAAGVMVFMWALAAVLFALQKIGVAVGWGLQFQSPTFLVLMLLILGLFTANLFGLFEFSLPAALTTRLMKAGGTAGYGADFATGFFGAVMATPCSAPFLGTAIAFALAGRVIDIAAVFTFLGLGLASPYLLVAIVPNVVRFVPKPGRWMIALKASLGILLMGTAAWLFYVLLGVAGSRAALTVASLGAVMLFIAASPWVPRSLRWPFGLALAALAVAAAPFLATPAPPDAQAGKIAWVTFDRGDIARRVSRGEVVFVDVTADWCLTCKANKALVLERDPVLSALNSSGVTPMLADWTRPDDAITRFLETNNRYGIPFNAVYGPSAPEGIILSEILSTQDVLAALHAARPGAAQATLIEDDVKVSRFGNTLEQSAD